MHFLVCCVSGSVSLQVCVLHCGRKLSAPNKVQLIQKLILNVAVFRFTCLTCSKKRKENSPLLPQFVPTYQATDLRFKRFLDDVLATNYIPTCHKAADLRFKRFLDDILASNYYYQSQMYNVHLLMTKHY